jgi:hypothetical protein
MRSTASATPRHLPDTASRRKRRDTAATAMVSLPRLYFLRFGYLVIAVGLVLTKWPLLINHDRPWPLFEGVETCMLVALSLLWFLGLRYPLQMLPALLFEIAWKLIWMAVVVLPLWTSDQLDAPTLSVFYACLFVVIPLAVIPWRYVFAHYVLKQGDPWRSAATGAARKAPPEQDTDPEPSDNASETNTSTSLTGTRT